MALQLPAAVDQFDPSLSVSVYAKIEGLQLDFKAQMGRLVVNLYKSAAAAAGGSKFINTVTVTIPTQGQAARPAQTNPVTGAVVVPAHPATIGFVDLMKAGAVSGKETVGTLHSDLIKSDLYAYLKTLPEFAGATDV